MRRSSQLLLAVFAALLIAVPAAAAQHTVPAGNAVLSDCDQHGALSQHYTHAQLSQALTQMPTWMKQYTTCQSVIQTALANGKVSANGAGQGGGGSSISTGVIVVIVVVVLAIVLFAGLLIRRRRRLTGPGSAADAPTQVIEPDRPPADDDDDG
jgi:hypothetical protein